MHPKYTVCNRCMTSNNSNENIKKNYTISGRTIKKVVDDTIDILIGHYQVNKEFMDDADKIKNLENIVDLISIKEHI